MARSAQKQKGNRLIDFYSTWDIKICLRNQWVSLHLQTSHHIPFRDQQRYLQKCSRLICLLHVRFGELFLFGQVWQYSSVQTKYDKGRYVLTCSSNITLSLLSYAGSALKRELNFCNGYISLLYFCCCIFLYF